MDAAEVIDADGVIAVVRLGDLSRSDAVVEALVAGGVRAIEFTFTNRGATRAIETAVAKYADRAAIGAGSVLDAETARVAILAGASFIVTPTVSAGTVSMASRYGVPTIIGGFTPTELLTAWESGASYVKVFPATIGGPGYIKDVHGPLPQLRLIPTGGVTPQNAGDFIRVGAHAVALGGQLVDGESVRRGDWERLTERARSAIACVAAARDDIRALRSE